MTSRSERLNVPRIKIVNVEKYGPGAVKSIAGDMRKEYER